METEQKVHIDFERLKQNIRALSKIGKSKEGGIYRMAFTEADHEARQWLKTKMEQAGLDARLDGALNVIGRISSANTDRPAVIVGSHTDSVPNAGALDGSLGVLIGLECLQAIRESDLDLEYPLELISFSDEEGRFGSMFGSTAFAGKITPGSLYESRDLDGNYLTDMIKGLGYDPEHVFDAARDPASIKCYLELHIEQGPVLDTFQKPIGIVSDITGLFKWQIVLKGSANHAGTTPMDMRNDAFMGLADFAHEIPRIISENGSEHSRMTIGKVQLYPGSANTVPEKVMFSLDVRDVNEDIMQELRTASRKALSAIARNKNLKFDFEELNWISPVACDDRIKEVLIKTAEHLGYDHMVMPSGAAHDAQMIAQLAPIGMIFVPSKGGISHSMHEWTDWRDIEAGATLMLNTLLDLTRQNRC